jgi:hypothetical protein
MSGLRVIEASERWALGEIDRCVLVVWRLQPNEQTMRTRAAALLELCAKYEGKCALLEIVEPTSKPPNEATRRVAMEVFRDLGPRLSVITFALEGDQIRTAVVRAIITAMLFFVKQPQPTKVCRTVAEATSWVRTRLDGPPDFEEELTRGLDDLRRSIQS